MAQERDRYDTINKKAKMVEALTESLGIVTDACRVVGISRETHYRWREEDSDYKIQTDSIGDVALDFVEGQLFKNIKEGKERSVVFYMETKGKRRGYIKRSELAGVKDAPLIGFVPDFSKYTTEEIRELLEKEREARKDANI